MLLLVVATKQQVKGRKNKEREMERKKERRRMKFSKDVFGVVLFECKYKANPGLGSAAAGGGCCWLGGGLLFILVLFLVVFFGLKRQSPSY